jgi:hypothetical protein
MTSRRNQCDAAPIGRRAAQDGADEAKQVADDAQQAIEALCSAISSSHVSANSATEEMLFELDLACP